MDRYLITGAGGVVGLALVNHLKAAGKEVTAIRTRSDCNLEDPEETSAAFERIAPTHVFHLAGAVFGVGGNLKYPGDSFRRNVLMNTHVVEACRAVSVKKVVAMGSAAMYSDNLNQPMSESDALGGEPHGSEFAYAFAKRALLVQLMSYRQQFGIEYAFAIATNMYGPGDRFNTAYGHVVPSLLRKFIDARDTGDLVEVWGDGSPTRDFLYAVDAARALDLLMTHGSGTYNVASGTVHTIGDLVRSVASSFPTVKYYWNKDRPMGQMVRSYDISRLKALGFKPEYSLDEGIRETVNWLEKNRENLRQ